MDEWDTLERSEKSDPSAFTQYLRTHKLDDIPTKMAAVMKDIGLGNKPYEQNIPESVNNMMKDWWKFTPQDMDGFIINLFDVVQLLDQEDELAWFAMSDTGGKSATSFNNSYQPRVMKRLPKTSARLFFKNVNIICPDQEAYKRCCNFKITSSSNPSTSARQLDCALCDLSPLSGHFSREAQASLLDKAKTVLYNDQFRHGFKASVYFLDCKGPTPHRVQCFKV